MGHRSRRPAPGRRRPTDPHRAARSDHRRYAGRRRPRGRVGDPGRAPRAVPPRRGTSAHRILGARKPRGRPWWPRSGTPAVPSGGSISWARTPSTPTGRISAGRRDRTTTPAITGPASTNPIEKFTSEVICTVPAGTFVLSNGVLHERTEVPSPEGGSGSGSNSGNRVRWHYRLDFPHPAYLVTLVAGPFVELVDRAAATGVDVYYYVAPGRESDGPSHLRAHAADDRLLLGTNWPHLSPYPLQPDHRARVHFRGHGEHHRDDADRLGAPRRAGGPGPRHGRAGVARARPSVVGRPAHLPRVVRGLVERRVRHLFRVRLARARTRDATRPTSSCSSMPTAI